MTKCPSCGRQHRPGTLFCSECGVYLPTGGPLRTEPLPKEELPASQIDSWVTDDEDAGVEKPLTLRIIGGESERRVQLPIVSEAYLGRLDAAHGIFPDLDLTADDASSVISRRHAKIHRQGSRFFIEDVGSANGTFLNGQRLTPYLPHPLQKGDKLQLGKVQLIVEFD